MMQYIGGVAPRRPLGLAGLFYGEHLIPPPPPPKLAVLIDYQNLHLTGRDTFAPVGATAKDTLVHPLKFAQELVTERAARQGDATQRLAELAYVGVYRGLPSNSHEARMYAVSQAQAAEWTRDARVHVWYRSLRYPPTWPHMPAREKGVDVKVAIDLVLQ